MGGRWWGEVDDEESIATVHKALDLGVNLIDTADVYGFGRSEKVLGKALGARRKDILLATKVGLRYNNKGKVRNDLSRAHILQAIDASLERLQTDYIDLYQIHWPDPKTPIEETVEALQECVEAGKVRYLGASNLTPEQLADYRRYSPIETLQPPLNLFERQTEVRLLPICLKENVGVLIYSPLCRGLLSGKFEADHEFEDTLRKHDPLFQGETFKRNLAVVDQLKVVAEQHNKTVAQLAVAWVLAHSAVSVALCGGRRPAHIADNVGAANWGLSDEDLKRIDQILVNTQPIDEAKTDPV